jgi:hypothetical protein
MALDESRVEQHVLKNSEKDDEEREECLKTARNDSESALEKIVSRDDASGKMTRVGEERTR